MRHIFCVVLLGLLGVMAGCGQGGPGAEFTFISSAAHHDLDPQKMSWLNDVRLAGQMYEPLVRYDFNRLEARPGVAERWEVSEDGRQWTFHLRDNARWSSGDAVEAEDFVFAWRRALLPDTAAQYARLLHVIEGAADFAAWRSQQLTEYQRIREEAGGVEDAGAAEMAWDLARERFAEAVGLTAADERTLVVRLERPVPYLLEMMSFVTFLPNHAASVAEASRVNLETGMVTVESSYWSDSQRLVTNGPYRLTGRQFKEWVDLAKNEHYWAAEAVGPETVRERIIEDAQNALLTYRSGGADFWPDVPTMKEIAAGLVSSNAAEVHTQRTAGTYFYNYNCRPTLPDGRANPLADARVRQAFSLAIDREALVKHVTRLEQPVARSFVPPGTIGGYEPPVEEGVGFDPEQARTLLAEAGYPGGRGLEGLRILYNTDQGHERVAEAISGMWRTNLGVRVGLEGEEGRSFGQRLRSGQFIIARASWFGDYPDPTTFLDKLRTGNGNNDCGWTNPRYDELMEQAEAAADRERRMELLREAETVLLEEQPMALLFQYRDVYLWDPAKVAGLKPNPWVRWEMEKVRVTQ